MGPWKVPLSDVIVSEQEIEAVGNVLRSGWLSLGPRTGEFEEHLADYVGTSYAVAVANCTAALHLMCLALGCGPGDEVIVPSMTFVATANAVAYTGARPVFADILSPSEPWLDVGSVERLVGPRTKAVMAVDYGGHCGQIDQLASLCRERDLVLFEDAAHALGSRLGERHLGTLGIAGAYSFFSNKNLAVGEGGAIVTSDPELAARLRLLRSHGMTSLSWDRHEGRASRYDVVALGFNYRIDEPRAALATERLARLDEQNLQRAALVSTYRRQLSDLPLRFLEAGPDDLRSAHHLFCVVLDRGVDRDRFRAELAERRVQSSIHYPPVHHFSIYRDAAVQLPVTDDYGARTVTLPLFPHMTAEQQETVIDAVRDSLRPAIAA